VSQDVDVPSALRGTGGWLDDRFHARPTGTATAMATATGRRPASTPRSRRDRPARA